MNKKLYKVEQGKMIDGVCAGIGQYFNMDPTIVRLALALFCLLGGSGIVLYLIAACIMPRETDVRW